MGSCLNDDMMLCSCDEEEEEEEEELFDEWREAISVLSAETAAADAGVLIEANAWAACGRELKRAAIREARKISMPWIVVIVYTYMRSS